MKRDKVSWVDIDDNGNEVIKWGYFLNLGSRLLELQNGGYMPVTIAFVIDGFDGSVKGFDPELINFDLLDINHAG